MEFDAFISHSSKDKTAADAACAVLEAAGVRCWVAPRDVRPGREYGAEIIDAIGYCRVMVLIFSSNANDSRQVHREIERAVNKGVTIVPVRIEEVVPTKSMEYFLGAIHWLDAMTPPIETHLKQLATTVKAILQVEPGAGEAVSSGPRHDNAQTPVGAGRLVVKDPARMTWLLPTLGGAGCVALAAAAVWFYAGRTQTTATVSVVPQPKPAQVLVPEQVPLVSDRNRAVIRSDYLPAKDHKALAISLTQIGFVSDQQDDDTAKAAALDNCRKATIAGGRPEQQCDLYALGDTVIYTGGRPPLPPEPWLVRNAPVERPFAADQLPLVSDSTRAAVAKDYAPPGAHPKALALSPRGGTAYFRYQSAQQEAIRRALEGCGSVAGVPCMIVAVDDSYVVAVPVTMKVVGFFRAGISTALAPETRDGVTQQLASVTTGWNSVAVGDSGRPGLALGAANEQAAVDAALANCSKQDRNCRVIAIGPFAVDARN